MTLFSSLIVLLALSSTYAFDADSVVESAVKSIAVEGKPNYSVNPVEGKPYYPGKPIVDPIKLPELTKVCRKVLGQKVCSYKLV